MLFHIRSTCFFDLPLTLSLSKKAADLVAFWKNTSPEGNHKVLVTTMLSGFYLLQCKIIIKLCSFQLRSITITITSLLNFDVMITTMYVIAILRFLGKLAQSCVLHQAAAFLTQQTK